MNGRPCAALCWAILTLAFVAAHGALTADSGITLRRVAFRDLPGWRDDTIAQALPALRASCRALEAEPADRPMSPEGMTGTAGAWRPVCRALAAAKPRDAVLRPIIEASLVPFA